MRALLREAPKSLSLSLADVAADADAGEEEEGGVAEEEGKGRFLGFGTEDDGLGAEEGDGLGAEEIGGLGLGIAAAGGGGLFWGAAALV